MEEERNSAARPGGYLVVLLGAVAFVGSCFLPYYDPGTLPMGSPTWSLFRTMTFSRHSALGQAGGYLTLFAGVATVAWIAGAGLLGHRRWAPPALLAAAIVWSLTWIGSLLSLPGFLGPVRFGYWFLLLSIGVVLVGAVGVWLSGRTAAREEQQQPTAV
jgi:hypothetical protein